MIRLTYNLILTPMMRKWTALTIMKSIWNISILSSLLIPMETLCHILSQKDSKRRAIFTSRSTRRMSRISSKWVNSTQLPEKKFECAEEGAKRMVKLSLKLLSPWLRKPYWLDSNTQYMETRLKAIQMMSMMLPRCSYSEKANSNRKINSQITVATQSSKH